jgi:hypothetical protein
MHKDIYYQEFGPVRNHWGYEITLAIIDDLYITRTYTPYKKKQIRYFVDELDLTEYIDLLNQDRRF